MNNENFIDNLHELDNSFQSVPEDIADNFASLKYKEQLEVIQNTVEILLTREN